MNDPDDSVLGDLARYGVSGELLESLFGCTHILIRHGEDLC